jgi:hypothetical protein
MGSASHQIDPLKALSGRGTPIERIDFCSIVIPPVFVVLLEHDLFRRTGFHFFRIMLWCRSRELKPHYNHSFLVERIAAICHDSLARNHGPTRSVRHPARLSASRSGPSLREEGVPSKKRNQIKARPVCQKCPQSQRHLTGSS